MRTHGWSFSQQGAWLLLLLLIFLVPACATTRDPTEMSEVRWELERLAEDRFLADGELGARSCVLDAMGERCREWRQFRADLDPETVRDRPMVAAGPVRGGAGRLQPRPAANGRIFQPGSPET